MVIRLYPHRIDVAKTRRLAEGDYGALLKRYPRHRVRPGSNAEFNVAQLTLFWAHDDQPLEPSPFTSEQGIERMRRSAENGHRMAAGFMRWMYQEGRFGMPRDNKLTDCWRKVEAGKLSAQECRE